jgi:hypothetical protein
VAGRQRRPDTSRRAAAQDPNLRPSAALAA